MIVCICHRVSDRDIHRAVREGCDSFDALQEELRVATACGACTGCAHSTFERACAGAKTISICPMPGGLPPPPAPRLQSSVSA